MTVTKNEKREKSQVCCGFSRHLVKQSLRGFFDKMLSDLQNQFLYHDFAILSPRRVMETLTVSFHTILPSETFGWAGYLTV